MEWLRSLFQRNKNSGQDEKKNENNENTSLKAHYINLVV